MFQAHTHSTRYPSLGRLLAVVVTAIVAGCAEPKAVDQTPQNYTFWPPSPDEPRIQFLVSYRFSRDVEPPTSELEDLIYGQEQKVLPINKPYGVEMWEGKIYVCDLRNRGVVILDLKQQQTRVMGVAGNATLGRPTDIAIAADGMKYVADIAHNMIFVFDANDRYVTRFGHADFKPVGVTVWRDELYVCDFVKQRVEIMDRHTGRTKRTVGQRGMEDGQFIKPLGIDVDSNGNFIVADVLKGRVQKFDPQGKFALAFGTLSDAVGSFVRPKHVAVDNDNNIYVVDASFQNVQVFNEEGQLLMFFGSAGKHSGAMYLPAGICTHEGDLELFDKYVHPAFEAKRLLIVTNQFGVHKVAVYALGQLRPGKTVEDLKAQRVEAASGLGEAPDQESAVPPPVAPGAAPLPDIAPPAPSSPPAPAAPPGGPQPPVNPPEKPK